LACLVSGGAGVAAGDDDPVPADSPNCQACEIIARGIEIELRKLEEPALNGLSEEEMASRCAALAPSRIPWQRCAVSRPCASLS